MTVQGGRRGNRLILAPSKVGPENYLLMGGAR